MRHRIKFNPRRNNSATIARIMRAIKSPQSRRLIYKREHEDIVFTRLKGPNFSYKVPLRMPRMCRRPYEWAFGQYRWSLSCAKYMKCGKHGAYHDSMPRLSTTIQS